jgi:RNA 2',3'-cyclic 3'-phosphodiesterase
LLRPPAGAAPRREPNGGRQYLAERGALVADTFTAERFVLYSARERPGGGPYIVEAAYPLG